MSAMVKWNLTPSLYEKNVNCLRSWSKICSYEKEDGHRGGYQEGEAEGSDSFANGRRGTREGRVQKGVQINLFVFKLAEKSDGVFTP